MKYKINELKLDDIIDVVTKNGIVRLSQEQVSALNILDKNLNIVELAEQSCVKFPEELNLNNS